MSDNIIGDYFGEMIVKSALTDYLEQNGNDRAAYDMLMILANNNKDKIIDIVCDYLDKQGLPSLT